jgi:hypothetical protein
MPMSSTSAGMEGQYVQIKLEQSALFDGKRVTYLAGRQTQWHVVRRSCVTSHRVPRILAVRNCPSIRRR